ncbi:PREDICTED: telomerase-binding protein EST1A isoform X2 [Nicrophorus vespilloides]|uniref:Telomerase-binding protein EST1A isoform X2 n=1 Tax=Nicrophorus vespilloides TaxID=110193 RepID=A0ABM1M7V6_NICVS|nr:PREDICTED: telomerase-binding protein EST1A isoform X2 [Nicrophorus vespilloides]
MPRGSSKPQLELYTPGSGPLRKSYQRSNNELENEPVKKNLAESRLEKFRNQDDCMNRIDLDNTTSKMSDLSMRDGRRTRKPEQSYYEASAVARSRGMSEQKSQRQVDSKNERNMNGSGGGNEHIGGNRNRKMPNRRRNNNNNQAEWRGNSPNRGLRQGSEPRGSHQSNTGGWDRTRDTRSVEPQTINSNRNFGNEKSHMKPPSGRRHSTVGVEPDKRNLPPRFQKKLMDENMSHYKTVVDDSWDGSSITFQGSAPRSFQKCYNHNSNQHVTMNNMTYNTLPNSRHKGRGRLQQEYDHSHGIYRSQTPDRIYINSPSNSRPSTPTFSNRTRSNESLNSRSQTPVNMHRISERFERTPQLQRVFNESLEAQLSPISPPSPVSIRINVDINTNTILDWSEEVEMHASMEAEALSDALTRSSSVTSLMDNGNKSPNSKSRNKKKRNRRHHRSGSRNRDKSAEGYCRKQNQSTDANFKVPEVRRPRQNSKELRSRNGSREPSFERIKKPGSVEHQDGGPNWREEMPRSRVVGEEVRKGGIIHLPPSSSFIESPKLPERPQLPDMGQKRSTPTSVQQRSLFDPNNPNRPIIVNKPSSRVSCVPEIADVSPQQQQQQHTDQHGKPNWHNERSDGWKMCKYPMLLKDIKFADYDMQVVINSGSIMLMWENIKPLRDFLKESLEYLLCYDLKFCQSENVENYFWRVLYHNIIEITRKNMQENREQYKSFLLNLIDEGCSYYESLLEKLEKTNNFKLSNHVGPNSHQKAAKNVQLALIGAQKILIFLGDLGRYREQVNETSNYGKCRQLYIKANDINPKNGRPYNQLAVLAVYSRKKLDAVYFYMRSLMSTNPVQSARESLISLFDENRKKYEHGERKRREERQERARQHMKEKESQEPAGRAGSLRKETWIRPDGGRRVYRTTSTLHDSKSIDSEEEDLASLSSVEVNKRFVTSYLHVQGKLITKVGMETFHETAMQMLKEFRALLQHSPLPLPSTRFLQLMALNMFAIESTQLKDPQLQSGYTSELQERALVVSLQMFSLILEKCVSLLKDCVHSSPAIMSVIPQDVHELLPSIKIWCDWMLCHSRIWNPPPSTQDFRVGPTGDDAWTRLAALINQLDKFDISIQASFLREPQEGYDQVRLPEDAALCGFTPLLCNEQDPTYVPKDLDSETAQFVQRLDKLLFFGTVFLCGLEPPVLKLEYQNDFREYVSVVCTTAQRSSPNTPPELGELVESFSEEEEDGAEPRLQDKHCVQPTEIQELLTRKVELEKRHRDQELHRQTVQKILQSGAISVHIVVKPKNLVPDTNCFIDYLGMLKKIASSNVYTLTVPVVVLNELEGLAKGLRTVGCSPRSVDPTHAAKVAEFSKQALEFLSTKHAGVKCITTKGTFLASTVFTKEDDTVVDAAMTNDDRILATCMTLCRGTVEHVPGGPRKLHREVVLLTEDRNLRVKALARDVPVQEVPKFLEWAGLG